MRDGHYALSEKAKRTYERAFRTRPRVAEIVEKDQAILDQLAEGPRPGAARTSEGHILRHDRGV